jgi:hypothetical protein
MAWLYRLVAGISILIVGVLSLEIAEIVQAQTTTIWSEATNISHSGGASQPAFTVSPDGSLHAIWWDVQDGALYARTTDSGATKWTPPTVLPEIYGTRTQDTETKQVSLTPPRDLRLIATSVNDVFAFWFDTKSQLVSAVARNGVWGTAEPLAQSILAINAVTSSNGALHIAAARSADSEQQPAGLYYLVNQNGRWSNPRLVYASPYFRALRPGDIHLSIASDAQNQVLITWDDPQLGRSVYARSADGGSSWSAPQSIVSVQEAVAQRTVVAGAPSGEFLMIWQEPGIGGCGYVQSRSADGGMTWTRPEKVLNALTRCNETLSFSPDSSGALWLIGHQEGATETARNRVSLAKLDGNRWSDPLDISHAFSDSATGRVITLGCLRVALSGQTAGLIGCDSLNDLWAARSTVSLDQLITLQRPIWSPVVKLSDAMVSTAENDLPALAADAEGNFLALWSQEAADGSGAIELYGAASDGTRWPDPTVLVRASDGTSSNPSHLQHPAIFLDKQDMVHAVWSTGTNRPLQYSSMHAQDFMTPQAWAAPVPLPSPYGLTSSPDIAVDPSGESVYVAFVVPFNENRGIYLVHSQSSGTTWMTPTLIFDAAAAGWSNIDKPQLALDASGDILHAAWMRPIPAGGVGPQAIYYARSIDQGRTWSSPVKVAEGNVDWPRLAVPAAGQVFLAWNATENIEPANQSTPFKVSGQFSPDGGQRWSPALDIPGFERASGPIALAVGGAGQMYLVATGQGSGQEAILLDARWNGQAWEMHELLPLGQPATAGNAAVAAANPAKGQLMTVLKIHTLDQPGADRTSFRSTWREVELGQTAPLPTFTPAPTAMATPRLTSTPQPTPRPTIKANANLPSTVSGGSNPLITGGVLAALIVVTVFTVIVWRQHR